MEIAIGYGKSLFKRKSAEILGKKNGHPKDLKNQFISHIHNTASGILRYPKALQIPHYAPRQKVLKIYRCRIMGRVYGGTIFR